MSLYQGFYGLSDVTVKQIPEAYQNVSGVTATAADVLANKVIVDAAGKTITGTMPNNGAVSKTLDTSTGNTAYTIPKGYHNGSGKVQISLEEKTATPEKSVQEITPSAGKVLSKVTVNAIPKTYQDAAETINEMIMDSVNGAPVYAADVLTGKVVYVGNENTNAVEKVTGTMPNHGAIAGEIDGLTTTVYTIPEGYHDGTGDVSLTNDIETALAAI